MANQFTFLGDLGLPQSWNSTTTTYAGAVSLGSPNYGGSGYALNAAQVSVGGTFVATTNFTLTEAVMLDIDASWPLYGLTRQFPPAVRFAVWDQNGVRLTLTNINVFPRASLAAQDYNWNTAPASGSTGAIKVDCYAGKTYTYALLLPRAMIIEPAFLPTTAWLRSGIVLPSAGAPLVGAPNTSGTDSGLITGPIHWLSSAKFVPDPTSAADGNTYWTDPPVSQGAQLWTTSMKFNVVVPTQVQQSTPPDPVVFPGGQQFTVGIRRSWMPTAVSEWTLQSSHSPDGASDWSNWETLGTFQISNNVYIHSHLDPFDKPFYKYRYSVASASLESDWSEETYAGQVQNYLTTGGTDGLDNLLDPSQIPSGAIGAQQLNVGELSAISANIGTITAGVLSGPLFQTSGTNPRVYMQQGAGLQATDAAGTNVFALDATTGNLTLKGAIQSGSTITGTTLTGGTVQTGSTGARVVMTSAGLSAYAVDGTTKLLDFKTSDGSLTITGSITATGGSVIDGGYITANTITAAKLLANTITAGQIAANTITAGQIAATTITAAQIAADTITAGQIAANAITSSELAAGSVTSGAISSGAVQAGKLASGAVQAGNLAAGAVQAGQIAAGAIDGMVITGGTVRTAASGSRIVMDTAGFTAFNASNVAVLDFNIGTGNLTLKGTVQTGSVVPTSTLSGTVTGGQIATNTVTGGNIALGTITATNIATDTITANEIAANAITVSELAANAVTAAKILANTITAGQIAAGTITATEIAANTITTAKLTATAIDGMTITGATVRTAATGARTVMTASGLQAFDAANANVWGLDNTGLRFNNTTAFTTSQLAWTEPATAQLGHYLAYYSDSATFASVASHAIKINNTITSAYQEIRADHITDLTKPYARLKVGIGPDGNAAGAARSNAVVLAQAKNTSGSTFSKIIVDGANMSDFLQWGDLLTPSARKLGLQFYSAYVAGPAAAAAPAVFNFNGEAGMYIVGYQGSAYAGAGGVNLIFDCFLDSVLMGSPSAFTNEASSHKSGTVFIVNAGQKAAGSHQMYISCNGANGTLTDAQDRFLMFALVL